MATQLKVYDNSLSVRDVHNQVKKIDELKKSLMSPNEHYGFIGNSDKPTLLKSGAEKICFIFRLTASYEVKSKDLPNAHREFEIICKLNRENGEIAGSGVGLCSTMESKFRWRKVENFEVLDEKIPRDFQDRKEFYKSKGFYAKKINSEWKWVKILQADRVENPDIADTYNTVLKMAKKRAFVDAVLTSTASSDFFTQDLDDASIDISGSEKNVTPPTVDRDAKIKEISEIVKKSNLSDEEINQIRSKLANSSTEEQFDDVKDFALKIATSRNSTKINEKISKSLDAVENAIRENGETE